MEQSDISSGLEPPSLWKCLRGPARLSKTLGYLGYHVGSWPWLTLALGILLPAVLIGTLTPWNAFQLEVNVEYLFVPLNTTSVAMKDNIDRRFPVGMSDYTPGVETAFETQVQILIENRQERGKSVLTESIWNEVKILDNEVTEQLREFLEDGSAVDWNDVCHRRVSECVRHHFFELQPFLAQIRNGSIPVTYPVFKLETTGREHHLNQNLGGVTLSPDEKYLRDASAIRLMYPLNISLATNATQRELWEQRLLKVTDLLEATNQFKEIRLNVATSNGQHKELTINMSGSLDVVSYAMLFVSLLATFLFLKMATPEGGGGSSSYSFGCNPMRAFFFYRGENWVVGILAITATGIAMLYALSIVVFVFGQKYALVNLAGLFLLLGVGLDDTIVIFSAFSKISEKKPANYRLMEAYEKVADSITLTSMTNFASFTVGIWAAFPCVQLFCGFCATGIALIYFCTLTIFGAFITCVANFGRRFSHYRGDDSNSEEENPSHTSTVECLVTFFRKRWPATLLCILYLLYVAFFLHQALNLPQGLEKSKLTRTDSRMYNYFKADSDFFSHEPYRLQFLINEELDYSQSEVQDKLGLVLTELRDSKYISRHRGLDHVWFENFADEMSQARRNISTTENYFQELFYLRDDPSGSKYIMPHVVFNEDNSKVSASRFFLQTASFSSNIEEGQMLTEIKSILSSSSLDIQVFCPFFYFFEQYNAVWASASQSVLVCLAIMTLLSLVFIQQLVPTLTIVWTIVSILIGVAGSMTMLSINLDVITMICLIMCVGFSVDFSAHITHHFCAAASHKGKGGGGSDPLLESLKMFAEPILSSSVTTMLSVSPLLFLGSYILNSFATMLLLVMGLGAAHGLLFLPIFLTLVERFYELPLIIAIEDRVQSCWKKMASFLGKTKRCCFPGRRSFKPNGSVPGYYESNVELVRLDAA